MQNLSASDLLSLEAAFYTAPEEGGGGGGGPQLGPSLHQGPSASTSSERAIKSHALVDSNNEESSSSGAGQDDDEEVGHAAERVGPRGAPGAAKLALENEIARAETSVSAETSERRQRLARKRMTWRDRSLRETSMWLDDGELNNGDGDAPGDSHGQGQGNESARAQERRVCANRGEEQLAPGGRALGRGVAQWPSGPRIQVDTCNSIDRDDELRRRRQQQQRKPPPPAEPPSRSCSAHELRTAVPDGRSLTSINNNNFNFNWIRAPGHLVLSHSSADMTQQAGPSLGPGSCNVTAGPLDIQLQGSLSDSSARPLASHSSAASRAGHFTSWKRSNKYVARVHENPLNRHLDCLERLGLELSGASPCQDKAAQVGPSSGAEPKGGPSCEHGTTSAGTTKVTTITESVAGGPVVQQVAELSPEGVFWGLAPESATGRAQDPPPAANLSSYADNLSHLYTRHRDTMDSSNNFRTLLYNIICCLLAQDEQVLATPSVSKMLDVIRTHLDSASRVYAHTSAQLAANLGQLNAGPAAAAAGAEIRRGSSGSLGASSSSTTTTTTTTTSASAGGSSPLSGPRQADAKPAECDWFLRPVAPAESRAASSKPVDFRRVSSVSYKDEQLISDLCEAHVRAADADAGAGVGGRSSGSRSACASGRRSSEREHAPSPWAYQELSERRLSGPGPSQAARSGQSANGGGSQQCTTATSQSSLEQLTLQPALNDDSGNGTMYDFQIASDFGYLGAAGRCGGGGGPSVCAGSRRASADLLRGLRAASLGSECFGAAGARPPLNRRLSDFRPQQQPSYMSTDEYLTSSNNDNNNNNNNTHTQARGGPNTYRASLYDEDADCSSAPAPPAQNQHRRACGEPECGCAEVSPVDVAGRRAELEWTLNKLINIELKLIWLTSRDTLRRAIRKIGVPNEIRAKVWLILLEQLLGARYEPRALLECARATIRDQDELGVRLDDETQSILKQIELDVNRTMPGHRLFDDGAEGGVKLRRILVAYSIHVNRAIAYCQGFNFIVALLLSVFEGDEENALRGFICIVDHIFPSKYYFDHYLTGARADQFLLADFICDQLIKSPSLAERKMVEGITSSITLNWFISLFHGAVPTLTRLTILDHFMLEGVKALFRFTMAILYLAFQVTPPSSCEIFATIRNTAREMYDIKLLLSIVSQIKLPRDSYFAIRRSFYMVQSSFNSDQFYMASLSSSGTSRNLATNKPLSVQRQPDTRPPALSLMSSQGSFCGGGGGEHQATGGFAAPPAGLMGGASSFTIRNSICTDQSLQRPRARTSADRSKVAIQSIGKLGRSHLRIMDANARTNERALMSPLRNCLLLGLANSGRDLIVARQASKRNFRCFREQELTFHVHEISSEIFDGFYLEEAQLVVIITQQGELLKVDLRKCAAGNELARANYLDECTETLTLCDANASAGACASARAPGEHQRVKLRLSTLDSLTNLLWIYVECEDLARAVQGARRGPSSVWALGRYDESAALLRAPQHAGAQLLPRTATRFRNNNPFLDEIDEFGAPAPGPHTDPVAFSPPKPARQPTSPTGLTARPSFTRKIMIVDLMTFDLFSAFAVHPNFGEITDMRASLVAFCQLSNPMSNQFSTRIVQIGPTGRYEQLLSFSDVVDYMVSVPESYRRKYHEQASSGGQSTPPPGGQTLPARAAQVSGAQQRYSSLRRLLTHSMSFSSADNKTSGDQQQHHHLNKPSLGDDTRTRTPECHNESGNSGTLTRYYRSLIKSYSMNLIDQQDRETDLSGSSSRPAPGSGSASAKSVQDGALRTIISSSFGDFSELSETNYIPVNMAFIFRNGKIALFEFTESYAIHTRESQLDRYDYAKVIDVCKNGDDFIVTILTVFDKLIKVII